MSKVVEEMKKTLGLITFFEANNHGVCLQTIATSEFLKSLGYDVTIINYINPYEHRLFRWCYKENNRIFGYLTSLIKNILLRKMYFYKKAFRNVRKYYQFSGMQYTRIEQIQDLEYDVLVCGSDQIWNSAITGRLDEVFLLRFGRAKKRISIASSLGSRKPTDEELEIFKQAFKDFDGISVREEFAKNCLQGIVDQRIQVICDPTFLLDRQQWIELLGRKSKYFSAKDKYILTYFISGDKSKYYIKAQQYAQKFGLLLRSIQFTDFPFSPKGERILGAGVEDFIALFHHAKLILTDSFHGVAFSINLRRNFVALSNTQNPLRTQNLLQSLDLMSRLDMEAEDYIPVDYTEAELKLQNIIEASKRWIGDMLKEERDFHEHQ